MARSDTRSFEERVDDMILTTAGQLSKLRGITIRGALQDFRFTCVNSLNDSLDFPEEDIWRLRLQRTDRYLSEPADGDLYKRLKLARERERDR